MFGAKKTETNETPKEKEEHVKPVVKRTVITEIPSSGRVFLHFGESKCGKTIAALSYGYLDEEYIPALKEAGFKYIPYALENNILSPVKKIVFIDSEGFLKQGGRPWERKLVGELFKKGKIEHVKVPTPSKKETTVQNKVVLDEKSVDEIISAAEIYSIAIEDACAEDKNTLIIIDSGTRLKWLLDNYADIIYTKKISSGMIKDDPKTMPMIKYGPRNSEWNRLFTLLKQTEASSVVTLMMTDQSEWVLNMAKDRGWKVEPKKREWVEKGSEYNSDNGIYFGEDDNNKKFFQVKEIRAIRDMDMKKHIIEKGDKFTYLWGLEEILREEMPDAID